MFYIVSSIPLELGSCSIQISHVSCCPFLIRVPQITSTGGYTGSCPSFLSIFPITGMGGCSLCLRVLPIMGTGGHPGRRPFCFRVLPITGMGGCSFCIRVLPITVIGGHSRRCPSLVRVLPITSLAKCPLLVRVLPILQFSSIFLVSKVILFVLGPFLTHTRHTGYLVKSSRVTHPLLDTITRTARYFSDS